MNTLVRYFSYKNYTISIAYGKVSITYPESAKTDIWMFSSHDEGIDLKRAYKFIDLLEKI